jgi:serine/threonine protein kinase
MGTVFLGVRDDDAFQKRIAIKVLKRGTDTDAVVQRFRHERQILASLDHPYIAGLLDGGTTPDGLPYFAMEYVEGLPIVEYCERHTLDTTARLQLFMKVCAAVQYAHQNLVIHRDIQPGNVLVTADGTPKLLDFGIAKLLNPELGGQLAPTVPGFELLGTRVLRRHQVRGDPVSTATDVYSLGVLLYESNQGIRTDPAVLDGRLRVARVQLGAVGVDPHFGGAIIRAFAICRASPSRSVDRRAFHSTFFSRIAKRRTNTSASGSASNSVAFDTPKTLRTVSPLVAPDSASAKIFLRAASASGCIICE